MTWQNYITRLAPQDLPRARHSAMNSNYSNTYRWWATFHLPTTLLFRHFLFILRIYSFLILSEWKKRKTQKELEFSSRVCTNDKTLAPLLIIYVWRYSQREKIFPGNGAVQSFIALFIYIRSPKMLRDKNVTCDSHCFSNIRSESHWDRVLFQRSYLHLWTRLWGIAKMHGAFLQIDTDTWNAHRYPFSNAKY